MFPQSAVAHFTDHTLVSTWLFSAPGHPQICDSLPRSVLFTAVLGTRACSLREELARIRCLPGAGLESQLCYPWPGRNHAGWLQGRLGTLGDDSLVWLVLVNPASGTLRSWWLFIPGAALRVVFPSHIFSVLPVCIQVHLAGPVLSDEHDSAT